MILGLLGDLTGPNVRFGAADDRGITLDCLKVEQAAPRRYLGVSHALRDGRFELRLSESRNLRDWTYVRTLDEHAHQGTLRRFGDRWLLAWEKDGPHGNWIRVAEYASERTLRGGKPRREFDVPRRLSQFAEGTPQIADFDPVADRLQLRFHYFRDGDVDRQAEGELRGFRAWTASARTALNRFFEPDFAGNVGDRDEITVDRRRFEIFEAQLRKNDWASWRILVSEGGAAPKLLAIRTPKHGMSYANPAVTRLTLPNGQIGIFGSYFLPSEGNAPAEAGSCLFWAETR